MQQVLHLTLLFRNIDIKIMHMLHSFCVLDTKDKTSETLANKPSKHEKVENLFTQIETSTSHVVLWIPKVSLKDSSQINLPNTKNMEQGFTKNWVLLINNDQEIIFCNKYWKSPQRFEIILNVKTFKLTHLNHLLPLKLAYVCNP